MSLLEMFSNDSEEFKEIMESLNLVRRRFEIIEDFHCQTIVEDCLQKEQGATFKLLFNQLKNQENQEYATQVIIRIAFKIICTQQ